MDTNATLFEEETTQTQETISEPGATDELKVAIEETLSKIRTQSMLLGAQAICKTVLDKIYAFESSNRKKSANDYKRCLKSLKDFCNVGLSRKVNLDGTTEPIEQDESETTQN